jgi:hypothetical protein
VLRVAVSEPDFFATIDHPARRLIDRMGACVMGFDSGGAISVATGNANEPLEKEIKRVVQVVEAYPDTGRRVFQTVLTEFEKFLENYFATTNEATKRGVSLAQQVEQRETLAIQYTIELRRMLNEVPVQEGVRQFLFHVWADVLATAAVRFGGQGASTKTMKRAAADLIWSASAKVTREERAEVIRRLPLLLKSLREGMASSGIETAKQDEHIQQLNNSLAAAFTAKAAVIPDDRLRDLMERLETPKRPTWTSTNRWCSTSRATRAANSTSCSTGAACRPRRWSPGRANCRSAAGTCSTATATAKRCNWPGTACASN